MTQPLLKKNEVATIARVRPKTIDRLVQAGRLPRSEGRPLSPLPPARRGQPVASTSHGPVAARPLPVTHVEGLERR
jgi:hypothetical protein